MYRKHKIMLCSKEVEYIVRRHHRARHIKLTVNCDASVVLTLPRFARWSDAENFLRDKAEWVVEKMKSIREQKIHWCCRGKREEYEAHKELARAFILKKVEQFNALYKFPFRSISIKNQKLRWGSCSERGNLNFNYRLLFVEDRLADYVIVHELCHLKELNHSKKFWNLVSRTIPDHRERRRELKAKF